jgi:hypothetical protein
VRAAARDGGEGGPAGAMVPPNPVKKKKNLLQLLFRCFIFLSINTFFFFFFFYFKKGMQDGNKFKRIIFVFKILFFFISWNAKSLIKFYIEIFSNSHGYGKPIFI